MVILHQLNSAAAAVLCQSAVGVIFLPVITAPGNSWRDASCVQYAQRFKVRLQRGEAGNQCVVVWRVSCQKAGGAEEVIAVLQTDEGVVGFELHRARACGILCSPVPQNWYLSEVPLATFMQECRNKSMGSRAPDSSSFGLLCRLISSCSQKGFVGETKRLLKYRIW